MFARKVGRRATLAITDEFAYAASNIALTVLVARRAELEDFSSFSVEYYAVGLGLLFSRAAFIETSTGLTDSEWLEDASSKVLTGVLLAGALGATVYLALLVAGARPTGIALATGVVVAQDIYRQVAIRRGRSGVLVSGDLLWLGVALLAALTPTVHWVVGMWVLGCLLSLVALVCACEYRPQWSFAPQAVRSPAGIEQAGSALVTAAFVASTAIASPAGPAVVRVADTIYGPAHIGLAALRGHHAALAVRLRRLWPSSLVPHELALGAVASVGSGATLLWLDERRLLDGIFGEAGSSLSGLLLVVLVFKTGQVMVASVLPIFRQSGRDVELFRKRSAAILTAAAALVLSGSLGVGLAVAGALLMLVAVSAQTIDFSTRQICDYG